MLRPLTLLPLACAVLLACGEAPGEAPVMGSEGAASPASAFEAAAAAHDVPVGLLAAIAQVETGVQPVVGEEEFPGQPRAYGVMGLREPLLEEAAALAGLSVEAVRDTTAGNVAGAAALLSAWADEAGLPREHVGAWAPVVARYSGIEAPEAVASYVHEGVFHALRTGVLLEGARLGKVDVEPWFPAPERADRLALDDAGAIWRPSPNFNSRSGAAVDFLIIHTCEGNYAGCWGWLANSASGVSAHYVVNETGSEVTQLVAEASRAWHISASYDCANNDNVECSRNGTSMNTVSVGIEHGGFASQTSWNADLIQTSAELACGITQRQTIPRDRYHIVAHGQLQPWNRTDPGANWPWADYRARIDAACGTVTPPNPAGSLVIDSNNAANDPAEAVVEVSASWVSSASVPGFWNTGYWTAPTQAISDPARFKFHADAATCWQVEAWWTTDTNRSRSAPWIAYDAAGVELGRAVVDQSANGGKWNVLGTWRFTQGWNQVILSRWTTSGYQVVADAIRLVPSTGCGTPPAPDGDGDGTPDASDGCPTDATKTAPGVCGCGEPDVDGDGDGVVDCVQPLTVDAFSPGRAGTRNTVGARGAEVGSVVRWLVAARTGTSSVPECPGLAIPLRTPTVIGEATANGTGYASLSARVPATQAGRTYAYVAVELSTCRVSSVRYETF